MTTENQTHDNVVQLDKTNQAPINRPPQKQPRSMRVRMFLCGALCGAYINHLITVLS